MKAIKRWAVRVVLVASLAAGAVGVAAGPASATTRSTGCVEWNSTDGCVVKQWCSIDTGNRTWSCLTFDTRTMLGGQESITAGDHYWNYQGDAEIPG